MKKCEKGITLVALVITIIILLILAGITIGSLRNSKLFERAKEAKIQSEIAQSDETEKLEDYDAAIDELNCEAKITNKVKPGDYIKYTPDEVDPESMLNEIKTYSGNVSSMSGTESTLTQETGLNWRVLDVVNGKVRLISDVPTTSQIVLGGYNGYNNAVYLLDKTCNTLYNSKKYSEKVQNLKIEDIQNKMKTDYTKIDTNYAKPFNPTTKYYPSIVFQEKDQTIVTSDGTPQPDERIDLSEQKGSPINEPISMSVVALNKAESFAATYTQWTSWGKEMGAGDFKDSIYYDLFINNGENYNRYWLSSRCIHEYNNEAWFDVSCVRDGKVHNLSICGSDGSFGFYKDTFFRPVVTLRSNVKIDVSDTTKDGTIPEKAYVLKDN